MKMQADRMEGQNAISRHGPEGIIVNGVEYRQSAVVPWRGTVAAWRVDDFDALSADHFAMLAALAPELVIFGSGSRLRFPKPVFAGDTLRIETTVLSKRESQSRKDTGIVTLEHKAFNQRNEEVASCRRVALMMKRPAK